MEMIDSDKNSGQYGKKFLPLNSFMIQASGLDTQHHDVKE
jgi:hypothetical protein